MEEEDDNEDDEDDDEEPRSNGSGESGSSEERPEGVGPGARQSIEAPAEVSHRPREYSKSDSTVSFAP